jgi:diguanylate cyclase (GGDEF)-like protein
VPYLLAVEAAAVASGVLLTLAVPTTRDSLVPFAMLVVAGLVTAELTHGVERMRRRFADQAPHVNMSSVWTLAAAVVTTPTLAAATALILYTHLWWRSWRRVSGMHPYRVVFSVSGVALSCYTAAILVHNLPGGLAGAPHQAAGVLALVGVALAYWLVNSLVLAAAIALIQHTVSPLRLLGSWSENTLEFATLAAGVFTAVFVTSAPGLIVLMPVLLCVLHRSTLVQQLEHAAISDRTTGLLNAPSWHSLAEAEFERAARHDIPLGLLLINVDDFRRFNDRYGQSAGDAMLRAIGHTIRAETRAADLCGRWAGEEFVVLLADATVPNATAVAHRICARVRHLANTDLAPTPNRPQVTVSIGVASRPDAGTRIEDVLVAADNALFAAKDAGRDQVHAVLATSATRAPTAADAHR